MIAQKRRLIARVFLSTLALGIGGLAWLHAQGWIDLLLTRETGLLAGILVLGLYNFSLISVQQWLAWRSRRFRRDSAKQRPAKGER